MTLQEAIEITQRTGDQLLQTDPDDIDEAERLNFEAMKAIMGYRWNEATEPLCLLPGETEE